MSTQPAPAQQLVATRFHADDPKTDLIIQDLYDKLNTLQRQITALQAKVK